MKIIAYKGFDKDWKCRDFQFEVGKTYKHEGPVKICSSGFHACEYPLDVFNYYDPTGQLATVELEASEETECDSKRVGNEITIKAALGIPELVTAAFEFTLKRCKPADAKHATGYRSASSATGYLSASSATGDRSASSATGYRSASSATGDRSASSATGYQSASSATGQFAVAAAFGLESKAMAGKDGTIIVAWWDGNRVRYTTGYVGEGIEPDVWYVADKVGKLVKA